MQINKYRLFELFACWYHVIQFLCWCCFLRWINLKVPFHEVFGGVRCNLKEAVEMAGLVWQGRAHCGLDDARNTARLLVLLMRKGFKFSITNSLMWQTTDHSLMWKQSPDQLSFSPNQSPNQPPNQPQKLKDMHIPIFQYHPYCFCGVKSSKGMVRKPGPKQGSIFFGCGNWTATRGALCHYFEWVSAWPGVREDISYSLMVVS